VRALMHGRTVTFRGEVYRANPENLESALSYIEDEIVNSGLNVGVEIDNQNGVVIGTGSPE